MAKNLSDILPDNDNGEEKESLTPEARAMMNRTTGLNLDIDKSREVPEVTSDSTEYDVERKITEDDLWNAMDKKADADLATRGKSLVDMIAGAADAEEERLKEQEDRLANDEEFKKTVIESNPASHEVIVAREEVKQTATERMNAPIDYDDLLPSYNDDDNTGEDSTVVAEKTESKKEDDDDDMDESDRVLQERLDELRSTELVTSEEEPVALDLVPVVHSRSASIEVVKSAKIKALNDQAFMNSINKFKRDNFKTVQAPLVNSGFFVDIVGTGPVDLVTLYTDIDGSMTRTEYEIEKMKIIIKNVVGTTPKIDRQKLPTMIHFTDYQIMAWAHICATLNEVYTVHNCTECAAEFRIKSKPAELLLNANEFAERKAAIREATSIDQYSLLARDIKYETESGYVVTIGHPSYVETINYYAAMMEYNKSLSRSEAQRFASLTPILSMTRDILMPNKVRCTTIYQRYIALTMMDTKDIDAIRDIVKAEVKKVIVPKFGIKRVTCPHCGHVNTDIPYDSLNDVLFFHSMVAPSTT